MQNRLLKLFKPFLTQRSVQAKLKVAMREAKKMREFEEELLEEEALFFNGDFFNEDDPHHLRLFTPEEMLKLTAEARGLLHVMTRRQWITPAVREEIIEAAMTIPVHEVGVTLLRKILFNLIDPESLCDASATHRELLLCEKPEHSFSH